MRRSEILMHCAENFLTETPSADQYDNMFTDRMQFLDYISVYVTDEHSLSSEDIVMFLIEDAADNLINFLIKHNVEIED